MKIGRQNGLTGALAENLRLRYHSIFVEFVAVAVTIGTNCSLRRYDRLTSRTDLVLRRITDDAIGLACSVF
ncbi:MAG: hypothetical protein KDN22_04945 [Verrucomicrobiae bacterium]|nr:hypothetical protein [Verrucomicrobiae bacterium]